MMSLNNLKGRRTMKKCAALLLVFFLVFVISGCFDDPDEEDYFLNLVVTGADSDPDWEDIYEHEGTAVDLPGADDVSRLGFTLSGWNTEEDGSGTSYLPGASFTMPGEDIALYAQWTFAPETITYTDLVAVTGGTYTHTDTSNYQTHSFTHTLDAYRIGMYELTYELWYIVYTWACENGYEFDIDHLGAEGHPGTYGQLPGSDKYEPVQNIGWCDAIVWCNAYSELSGYSPVYLSTEETVLRDATDINACNQALWDHGANGYRLPSDAEWQFAASNRGGLPYNYPSGSNATYHNEAANVLVAWYRSNAYAVGQTDPDYGTHRVGTKNSNLLGLYDMSGNSAELCWDWYADSPTDAQTNYCGPETGTRRVLRGGSYGDYPQNIIVGARFSLDPATGSAGYRLARNTQ